MNSDSYWNKRDGWGEDEKWEVKQAEENGWGLEWRKNPEVMFCAIAWYLSVVGEGLRIMDYKNEADRLYLGYHEGVKGARAIEEYKRLRNFNPDGDKKMMSEEAAASVGMSESQIEAFKEKKIFEIPALDRLCEEVLKWTTEYYRV